MPCKRFASEQVAFALRQAENGATVDEDSRNRGISEPTCLTLEETVRRHGRAGDPQAELDFVRYAAKQSASAIRVRRSGGVSRMSRVFGDVR